MISFFWFRTGRQYLHFFSSRRPAPVLATGPRAGRPIARVGEEIDSKNAESKSGSCCAMVEGFSVHAGVSVPARDRLRLERLLRYGSRGPISNERLSLLPDGTVRYKLKRRWKDGTKAVIYEAMEFMERLAALVPPPRFNIGIMGCWPLPQASGDILFRKINRKSSPRTRAAWQKQKLRQPRKLKPNPNGAISREIIHGPSF
jgi:hypothetical protein